MFRAWLTFEKDYINPFTGKVGRWRVIYCNFVGSAYLPPISGAEFMGIHVSKVFRNGTIVNPTKEHKKVIEARKGSA